MIKVPGRNGGTLTQFVKGEVTNKNGRPRVPKGFKDLLKGMESDETSITVEESAMERFEKDGAVFYKFKLPTSYSLFLAFLKEMKKGNARFWDMGVRMGFAGGYEPIKTENLNVNAEADAVALAEATNRLAKAVSNSTIDKTEIIDVNL